MKHPTAGIRQKSAGVDPCVVDRNILRLSSGLAGLSCENAVMHTHQFLAENACIIREGKITCVRKISFDTATYSTESTFSTQAEPTTGHSCIQNEEAGSQNII